MWREEKEEIDKKEKVLLSNFEEKTIKQKNILFLLFN